MKELMSRVTRKGQVTVPVQIRKALGLNEGDTVAFVLEGRKGARLRRCRNVVDQTAGVFQTEAAPLPAEKLRDVAEGAIAQSVVERGRK